MKSNLIASSLTVANKRLRAGSNHGSRRRIEFGLQMSVCDSKRAARLWVGEL